MSETRIRSVETADADAVARIYNHYVSNTIVTFEEEPVSAAEMHRRFDAVSAAAFPWLVAVNVEERVVGYAYATKWRDRASYRRTAETTVYLEPDHTGRGIGSELYRTLLAGLREQAMHIAVAGISLPNAASVAIHERFGFSKVAHFDEVGFKFEKWIDVGYWQMKL